MTNTKKATPKKAATTTKTEKPKPQRRVANAALLARWAIKKLREAAKAAKFNPAVAREALTEARKHLDEADAGLRAFGKGR